VETAGHNSVCHVECLFDTIIVMTVDVDVQDRRISAQEFNNEGDVVDEAASHFLAWCSPPGQLMVVSAAQGVIL